MLCFLIFAFDFLLLFLLGEKDTTWLLENLTSKERSLYIQTNIWGKSFKSTSTKSDREGEDGFCERPGNVKAISDKTRTSVYPR